MSKQRRTTLASTAIIAIITAAAFSAGSADAQAAPARGRPAIVIEVNRDHTVTAPAHVVPGAAHIRDRSNRAVLILDPKQGAGVATLLSELNEVSTVVTSDSTELPFAHDFDVVDVLPQASDAYLHLKTGVQYVVDAELSKYTAADVATMRVSGTPRDSGLPGSNKITITHHGLLTAPPAHEVSRLAFVRVRNESAQVRGVQLISLDKQVSARKLKRFLAKPSWFGLASLLAVSSTRSSAKSRAREIGVVSSGRAFETQYLARPGRVLILTLPLGDNSLTLSLHKYEVRLLTIGK